MAKIHFHIQDQKPLKKCTREAIKNGYKVSKLQIHLGMAAAQKAISRASLVTKFMGAFNLLLIAGIGFYAYADEPTKIKTFETIAKITKTIIGG